MSTNIKLKIKNLRLKKGFTLLELLVVIAIIGILLGLAAVSMSSAQKKGRDARKKGDLRSIQNGLEQYYSVCGNLYPTPDLSSPSDYYSFVSCTSLSLNILPTIPLDPLTTPYLCSGTCDSSEYKICTTLESESVSSYCVQSQQ